MKRLIWYIIFLFIPFFETDGQNVQVTSSFDSTRIYIGDQIKYTITIDQPSEINLTLPFFKDTIYKNIEILTGPEIDSLFADSGRIRIIEKYLITSFDSGFYQVPPVFAEVRSEGGLKRFYSDYAHLEVIRVKIAPADTTAKFFDIIAPYNAPVTVGEILPWALIAAIAGVVIWAIIKYLRNRKKNRPEVKPDIVRDPAHIIAFHDLEKLNKEELWQKGEIKKYYTRLTEILRQYLEDRYNVYSLELTTAETLLALVKSGFKKDETYNQLKEVLSVADYVKFAKYIPLPDENELHYKNSWSFVQATKVIETTSVDVVDKDEIKEVRQ